jgi:hypothetical protein
MSGTTVRCLPILDRNVRVGGHIIVTPESVERNLSAKGND